MAKLFNPTDNNITVTIFGVEYTIPAKGSADLEDEVAKYWKKELHNFLLDGSEEKVESTEEITKKVSKKK